MRVSPVAPIAFFVSGDGVSGTDTEPADRPMAVWNRFCVVQPFAFQFSVSRLKEIGVDSKAKMFSAPTRSERRRET